MKVSVNEVAIHSSDIDAVQNTLIQGWFSSSGPTVTNFENNWASYCEREYGISVSNGSTALLAAFLALELTPGAEVIMPNFTIISCASSIIQAGYVPIFIDCELDTFNIDVTKIEEKITNKSEAILIVHIYGHPSDVKGIRAIAKKYNLKIIEDAAEAHGAKYIDETNRWAICGSQFEMSTFSFFANKVVTTGEGGMVLTNDVVYDEKLRKIRNLYFPREREYIHDKLGYQFRLGSMQAAFGNSQINRITETLEKKRSINKRYRENLENHPQIRFQKISKSVDPNYWVIAILIQNTLLSVDSIRKMLIANEIETRPFFTGMHAQPALLSQSPINQQEFSKSEYATRNGIILPSGIDTTMEQIDYVSESLIQIMSEKFTPNDKD